ncbi:sulfatase-like hydrolase/transferase [Jiangella alkaliphila]|uniref:Arylsulfatase A n=1 Tax=Jiangella alkaliphila TaxID=419479 RepID=A0A1H2K787_9ACTN|nr:sulfatase-like hydrolase/transferase [Jiangella alkaliphila]SDU64258.1 Arylsulfatase A [Jiangella alkaliphila]
MADPDRPNVLVFLTDQQRFDSTGVHGNPLGLTPNLDRLAATGTHFSHAFTPQPVCAPARAALQTGQYQNRTGVYRNGCVLPPGIPTLAHHFGAAGYRTGYVGKWHLAGTDDQPVPPELRGGYEHWLGADVVEFISSPFEARLYDTDGADVRLPGYRADAYVDAAIDYLSRPRADPFLLFVSLIEPHHHNPDDDYPAPQGYAERYAGRWTPGDLAALGGTTEEHLPGYWGMVRRVDEAFGRLLDALQAHGLRDDTVVAFTSDHGCHFKTRNREYKRSAHDASIRVPLVLDGPGLRGGGRRDDLVSLIDLPPTLLDAAGLPAPDAMQGVSLLRERDRDAVFVQISESHVGRAIRTRRWKYSVRAPHADGRADPGAPEYVEDLLYDLDADPYELTNLAGRPSHTEVAAHLRRQLTASMLAAGEPVPVIRAAGREG